MISQDIVATHSEFVVKYNDWFVAYSSLNSMLKKFRTVGQYYEQNNRGPFFDSQSVYINPNNV
jgi:hypothetical protein